MGCTTFLNLSGLDLLMNDAPFVAVRQAVADGTREEAKGWLEEKTKKF